jgi:hypothetical protein
MVLEKTNGRAGRYFSVHQVVALQIGLRFAIREMIRALSNKTYRLGRLSVLYQELYRGLGKHRRCHGLCWLKQKQRRRQEC